MYLYREMYMTRRTVKVHAQQINALSVGERIQETIADHDASDRATLKENRINTVAAQKDVTLGIERVQERLKIQGDGRPRLFILRDSLVSVDAARAEEHKTTSTLDEIDGYVFPDGKEGKAEDENPVKVDDHGMDAMRYMVMHLDHRVGGGGNIRRERDPIAARRRSDVWRR